TGREYNYWKASGTSMSAPSVTGTLALLYERYRQLNGGSNPTGALMKAIACNTADDLGNVGPDYIYGFGLINGRRAVETIEQGQYLEQSLENGGQNDHSITVPAGKKQLKIMLYWHDAEAEAFAAKTLINDLDLVITAPNGQIYRPWVLNHDTLHVADLATRQIDTLNNIEQVTIDDPQAGNYTVSIFGKEVPVGPQSYVMTYEWVSPEVVVTFPYGGEKLVPGSEEMVQWDTDETNTQTFDVDYSLDGGSTWINLATSVPADVRYIDWTIPEAFTEQATVRVSKSGTSVNGQSSSTFYIIDSPENLAASPFCEELIRLTWSEVSYADSYEIYLFDGEQMSRIGTSQDTTYLAEESFVDGSEYWFSVKAISSTGVASERAIAVSTIAESGVSCQWDSDLKFGSLKIDKVIGRVATSAALGNEEAVSITINNMGTSPISNFTVKYRVDGGEEIAELCTSTIQSGDSLLFEFSQKADLSSVGVHTIDAWLEFAEDQFTGNNHLEEAVQVEQLANERVIFPRVMSFDENLNLTYSKTTFGLDQLESWDYETAGNGLLSIRSGIMSLTPQIYTDMTNVDNQAYLTMNLAGEDINGWGVYMNFKYAVETRTIGPLFDQDSQYDKIWIRGSDSDPWVLLYELDQTNGDWNSINNLNISSILLEAGQNYSSSTQLKFAQRQSAGFSLKDFHFFVGNPLPVDLLSFDVAQVGTTVVINWQTNSEHNNDYFDIQVAMGKEAMARGEFSSIGKVAGAGNSNELQAYRFVDKSAATGSLRYYRIKQVDLDQQSQFSPIKAINIQQDYPLADVFPNPFQDQLQLIYKGPDSESVLLRLINASGQLVYQTQTALRNYQRIDLEFGEELSRGFYWLQISDPEHSSTLKLLKQ
ncbi:MAG: S8 family peptidase, partial [Bacteroidota bacterium]